MSEMAIHQTQFIGLLVSIVFTLVLRSAGPATHVPTAAATQCAARHFRSGDRRDPVVDLGRLLATNYV